MFGGAAPLAEVQAAYEKAIPRINACADEMTDRRVALMRDSALLDRLYERNEGLYRELCSLIVVGDEVIAQARARGDKEQDIARMERRVQDLRITQVASTQLAAQIRAVQASDELTCSRLQAALEVTIPLWKSQMAAALGLARATDSLTMQKRAGEEAARGIKSGARELSAQTRAYAEAAMAATRPAPSRPPTPCWPNYLKSKLRWPNSRKSAALTQAQKEGFDYARLCHPNRAEADAEQSAAAKETKAGSAERPCRPAAERGNRRAGRDGRAGAAHRQFPRAAKMRRRRRLSVRAM